MEMKIWTLLVVALIVNNIDAGSDEEYEDLVINYLINGESFEIEQSKEEGGGEELVLTGGIWKCGSCAGVDDSMLVYSEVNDLDADVTEPLDVQISLSIPSMRCITVVGDRPGVVRRVSGACAGAAVTLSLAAASRFLVDVYADHVPSNQTED